MNSKKLITASVLSVLCLTASAQQLTSYRIGFSAGMNVAKITNYDAKARIGFSAGLRGEYNFSDTWYANIGMLLSLKGSKTKFTVTSESPKGTITHDAYYLEMPLHFGTRYFLSEEKSLFLETGPYIAYGIGGKNHIKGAEDAVFDNTDFFGSKGINAKRFDVGWGLKAGFEIRNVQLSIEFERGFLKLWDKIWDKTSGLKNSNLMLGIGYML